MTVNPAAGARVGAVRQILIPYYSMTDQTRRAAHRAIDTFRAVGHAVRECEIKFAAGNHTFPLDPVLREIGDLGRMARKATADISFDHAIEDRRYDLVLVFSPTWSFSPAAPIGAFLRTPVAARIFAGGTPLAAAIVCRGFWRHNAHKIKSYGTAAGARWLGAAGFTFEGNYFQTNHSFFAYHLHAGDMNRKLGKISPTPYGLSARALNDVEQFATNLLPRLQVQT